MAEISLNKQITMATFLKREDFTIYLKNVDPGGQVSSFRCRSVPYNLLTTMVT